MAAIVPPPKVCREKICKVIAFDPAQLRAPPPVIVVKPAMPLQNWHILAYFKAKSRPRLARKIIAETAKSYGVLVSDILSPIRITIVVRPRQVAMYLVRSITNLSFPETGRIVGGRDHTTAIHAFDKIEALIATDADLAKRVEAIRKAALA